MDDLKKLAAQFADAARVAGSTITPGIAPELANYSKASFLAPIVKAGIGAGGTLSAQRGKEADDADAAARQAQAQKLKDQMDPTKYQKVRKADGGFAFFDPTGKEIDVNDYAKVTGERRADVLKDSENPIDQEYINDYNNMQDLSNAFYNNDTDTISNFVAQNPSLKGQTPQQLATLLIKKYPHIYGVGKYQQTFNNRNQKLFSNNPNYLGAGSNALASLGQ